MTETTSAPHAPADDPRVAVCTTCGMVENEMCSNSFHAVAALRECIKARQPIYRHEVEPLLAAYDALAARTAELERTIERRDARIAEISNACNDVLAQLAAAREGGPSIREVQHINAQRSARWMAGSPGWTTLEIAGELAGEVGELANVCKKLRRSEMGVPGNKVSDDVLLQQARGEIGDVMIVLMLTASKLGIDLEDAVRDAFNAKSEQMGFPERIRAALRQLTDRHEETRHA